MERWSLLQRAGWATRWAFGLGALAGSLEIVALAAGGRLSLSLPAFLLLGAVNMVLMGALGTILGALCTPLLLPLHRAAAPVALAIHAAATGSLLAGYYLWQRAWVLHQEGLVIPAALLASMPLAISGTLYYNAWYALRRLDVGKPLAPWLPTALGTGMAIVVLSGIVVVTRSIGGAHALEDDRNLVLVTVSGWSGPAETPPGWIRFEDAVTPSPDRRPAAASLLTGLHPLRTGVISDGHPLGTHYPTLAEQLEREGYATAAFVSHEALGAPSGLAQGFRVFDDAVDPWIPGLLRLNLVHHLLSGRGWSRSAASTLARVRAWLNDARDVPFFLWLHLPAEDADPAIAALLDALEPVADETLIVLTATSGPPSRDDGVLYDDRIRVPLLLRGPGLEGGPVEPQVRLLDIPITATTWLGIEAPQNEGLDLAGFIEGARRRSIGCTLVGRRPDGTIQIGLRTQGVKYIARPVEELYRLADDPEERHNLAPEQPEALEQARRILAPDLLRLDELSP